MLLTVFYIAATWMQSWRLGSIKRRLVQFLNEKNSFVLYRLERNEEDQICLSDAISSEFCDNEKEAKLSELILDDSDVRGCILLPKQIIKLDRWISFPEEISSFPLPLPTSHDAAALKEPKLLVLVEAMCTEPVSNTFQYNIRKLGEPIAWKAASTFGLILRSDMDHLAEMSLNFMSGVMPLDEGLTVVKIQTVDVTGRPCLVLNTSKMSVSKTPSRSVSIDSPDDGECEWPKRLSACMSPTQWMTHLELLRNFSRCADDVTDNGPVVVPDHRSACLVLANKALLGQAPTAVVTIPESKEEEEHPISNETLCLTSDSTDDLLQSIPVTPEIKEIMRNVSPKNIPVGDGSRSGGSSPARIEGLPLFNASANSSCVSTPARANSSCVSTPAHANSSCASTPTRILPATRKNTFTSISSLGSVPSGSTISLRSGTSIRFKPPNVLVYSESPITTENIKAVLGELLHCDKYTIYSVSKEQLASSTWAVNCSLLVVCGNVPDTVEPVLINFLLAGGRLFCLCSSFLHTLLPTFRTAEVRERELVRFSYAKWSRVRLMHHVFCYQNSPAKTKFSREADEPPSEKDRVSPVPVMPATVQVLDSEGRTHTLHVQVLGKEETWQTPSLLLAYLPSPAGRVFFSQVHLELDPSEISEERETEALRSSDSARREIIRDILSTHLGLECSGSVANNTKYTPAYFLGRHEIKLTFLDKMRGNECLGSLQVKFCGKGETPPAASASFLPILIHACPSDFSTLEYFDTLHTESLGRLLIYCEVMGSSMDLVDGDLAHGLTVIPSRQTSGRGRSGNQWLSPPGCAMFSLQLHFPLDSYLGRHPSILQHVAAAAFVSALSQISPEYKQALDLHLKWPNDIYTGDMVKVGGVLATCSFSGSKVICNIGCGVNLNNDSPTTCLNSQISEYNKLGKQQQLAKLTREKVLALTFTKLEEIIDRMQEGDISYLHDLYYSYWLHGEARVSVVGAGGDPVPVVICGIDEWGYLRVREQTGRVFTVQPDGNSFDMMDGLIVPK